MLLWRLLFGMGLSILVVAASAAPAMTAPRLEASESGVRRIEALVVQARFREAAERASSLRREVLALRPSSASRRLLVRTELAAGTAALALGQENAARICFLRVLQLEPSLVLAAGTPPKVRHVLDSLREVRE